MLNIQWLSPSISNSHVEQNRVICQYRELRLLMNDAKPTFEDLFQREAITSRIQNDCGNWRLAFWVEMRVFGRSRRGRTERRNAANGSFRATKKALALLVYRAVDQLVTAELPVIRPELGESPAICARDSRSYLDLIEAAE
jgi:hypothetical protein